MSDYAELCSDHKCGNCYRCNLARALEARDDYKQAWQRDLAKGREFLAERDAARADVSRMREALVWIGEHCDAENHAVALLEIQKFIIVALTTTAAPPSPGTAPPTRPCLDCGKQTRNPLRCGDCDLDVLAAEVAADEAPPAARPLAGRVARHLEDLPEPPEDEMGGDYCANCDADDEVAVCNCDEPVPFSPAPAAALRRKNDSASPGTAPPPGKYDALRRASDAVLREAQAIDAPDPTTCKPWCAKQTDGSMIVNHEVFTRGLVRYCSPGCWEADKSLNPSRPTCATCGDTGFAWFHTGWGAPATAERRPCPDCRGKEKP